MTSIGTQGEARALARIFQHRFPDLASDDVARISGLDRDHSDRLAEFVVELASADELHNWLDANP